jgi:hypothetical protein
MLWLSVQMGRVLPAQRQCPLTLPPTGISATVGGRCQHHGRQLELLLCGQVLSGALCWKVALVSQRGIRTPARHECCSHSD